MKFQKVALLWALGATALGCALGQASGGDQPGLTPTVNVQLSATVAQPVTAPAVQPTVNLTVNSTVQPTVQPVAKGPTVPPTDPAKSTQTTDVAVATDAACPGAPPPRLKVDGLALVTAGKSNTLRSGPGTSNPVVGEIPGGMELTILGGPQCVGGYYWWQTNYNSIPGWTAEGQGTTYWLDFEQSPASTN